MKPQTEHHHVTADRVKALETALELLREEHATLLAKKDEELEISKWEADFMAGECVKWLTYNTFSFPPPENPDAYLTMPLKMFVHTSWGDVPKVRGLYRKMTGQEKPKIGG